MSKPEKERRRAKRFVMEMPVAVKAEDGTEEKCAARDISSGGIFFYCESDLAQDSPIEVVMILPPEITRGATTWVSCRARVVRVETDTASGQHGVAAKVERLEFLPEITA